MGFYSQVIFPRVCDFLMKQEFLASYRRELLAGASGDILEIGFGTGLNLPFYPPDVCRLTTVDANAGMQRKAKSRIDRSGIEVDQRVLDCEHLPFGKDAFDCVISSNTGTQRYFSNTRTSGRSEGTYSSFLQFGWPISQSPRGDSY